jgi:hypothetical protein
MRPSVRVVKSIQEGQILKEKKGGRTQKGFASLTPYMNRLAERYESKEIDATEFYEDIVFANNMLLGRAIGQEDKDEMMKERGDGFPAILHEPFLNAPVMMHLKRLSNQFPEIKDVQKADEEMNGSLKDLQNSTRAIRADISSFIADPINEGRLHQEKDINGIYQLLNKYDHPLGVTLSAEIPNASEGGVIAPNYKPTKQRKIRVAGRMQDPSFEQELNELRDKQKENLKFKDDKRLKYGGEKQQRAASDFYDKLFQEGEIGHSKKDEGKGTQRSVSTFNLKTHSTGTAKKLLEHVKNISREESVDESTAYRKMMEKFNNYMISLTGQEAFGTSGRAGKRGQEIKVGKSPDAITPSMRQVAEELGISLPVANIPDSVLFQYIKDPKSAYNDTTREDLANELSNMRIEGFHPTLISAMDEGGLLSTLYGDERAVSVEGSGLTGSQEEKEQKASEARRARFGGAQTEFDTMTPEDQVAVVQGKRKMTPSQQLTQLDQQLKDGTIDEYDYEMQRMAIGLGKHKLDPDAELGGLSGNDFEVGHAFHGLSENKIIKATNNFVDNLIGMSRIMRELRETAYANNDAQTPNEKLAVDEKLKAVGLTAENFVAFGNLDNATHEDKKRYNKLDGVLSGDKEVIVGRLKNGKPKMKTVSGTGTLGQILPVMTSRLNRQHDMMKDIGMSDVDLVRASMRYANADMGTAGYVEAFKSLAAQTREGGGLKTYPIKRLLDYMMKKGYREALDEAHHQKVEEQQTRFANNHTARQTMKEDANFTPASEYDIESQPPEHIKDLLHDSEECLSCHEDRFGTRDAPTARAHSPVKGKKSPFAHKSLTMPQFKNYLKNGEEERLYATGETENDTSLAAILRHIYPDDDRYNHEKLKRRRQAALDNRKMSVYRDFDLPMQKKFKNKIKQAIITGHPRAANIFKKFGLYRTKENAIASGPAGMTNKELVASSFFMRNDDSIDKHQESMRKKTLSATRFNAITDAMDFMEELADGVYGGKFKPGALKSEVNRRALLAEMIDEPKKGIEKAKGLIGKRKREVDSYKELYRQYVEEKRDYDANLAKTKPEKYKDEDGEERERRGEYQSPAQIEMIKAQGDKIDKDYGKMLMLRRKKLREIKTQEKKVAAFKDASEDAVNRTNEYMIGAFIKAGDKMANIFAKMKKMDHVTTDDYMGMLADLHNDMYGDDDYDSVLKGDASGRVERDFSHSLSNYKLGRMGEMGGTGVMSVTNNKAIPRVNTINQLLAHRIQMGFPLTEEDIERAKAMMHDGEIADTVDKEQLKEWAKDMKGFTVDDDEDFNMSELEHEHHDDTESELGLLTEDEAARREQNSHFTRGSEDAIANGNIEAHNLVSNWRQNAPTLCGVCHGHKFVTRGEAVSYIRHRIPGMENEGRESSKISKFISTKMRPRGFGSYDEHPMADEMEPNEHEQFACPACEHSADYVQGGKCSNGLCGDCFGTGVRDPTDDEHIQEGYIDAEGNKIDGKNHHYSHKGMVGEKFDYLNQLLLGGVEMTQSGEIPDYLKDVLQPQSPIWQMYDQHVGSGKYQTLEDEREARKKKKLQPIEIDENAPEIPQPPDVKDRKVNLDSQLPDIDFTVKPPAKTGGMPEIDFGGKKPSETIQLNSVNKLAMQKHNEIFLQKHLDMLYSSAVDGLDKRFDNISPEKIQEMKKEIDELYLSIVNDPALQDVHDNEDHHLIEKIHQLQEIADDRYTDDISDIHNMSAKERKAIRAKRRQLPTNEDGELQLTMDDVFGGNAPMSFGGFDKYTPKHGHMQTDTEIREGLFEPGQDNKPTPVTNHQLRKFFAGNNRVLKIIDRIEGVENFKPEKLEKIKNALSKIEKPLVARKTGNLYSESLNNILKEFGDKPKIEGMEGHQLTYSDEAMEALKEAGATDVNSLLTALNQNNQNRAINAGYTQHRNKAMKSLWQEYVLRKGLQHFMSQVNNPLDFPKIPIGINQNNFSEMVGEDSGLYQMMLDEAAVVAGYEDHEQLEKKLNMSTSPTVGGVKLNVKEFKADVLQNAENQDANQLPMGYIKYDANGGGQFITKPTEKILQEAQNGLLKPNDKKEYANAIRAVNYNLRPNYMRREEIRGVMKGEEGKHDGYDSHAELSTAFANKALPAEQQQLLETSGPLLKLSHRHLNPISYADAEAFDVAANEDLKARPAQQQQQQQQQDNSFRFMPNPAPAQRPAYSTVYGRPPQKNNYDGS